MFLVPLIPSSRLLCHQLTETANPLVINKSHAQENSKESPDYIPQHFHSFIKRRQGLLREVVFFQPANSSAVLCLLGRSNSECIYQQTYLPDPPAARTKGTFLLKHTLNKPFNILLSACHSTPRHFRTPASSCRST